MRKSEWNLRPVLLLSLRVCALQWLLYRRARRVWLKQKRFKGRSFINQQTTKKIWTQSFVEQNASCHQFLSSTHALLPLCNDFLFRIEVASQRVAKQTKSAISLSYFESFWIITMPQMNIVEDSSTTKLFPHADSNPLFMLNEECPSTALALISLSNILR